MGRYALRVFGESLGATSPLGHPAVKIAATNQGGAKAKADPAIDTEFVLSLGMFAENRSGASGQRLYAAMVALLALSSLRFGDTKQVQGVFNSGTALCGGGVNTKDKSGRVMTWVAPLIGLAGIENWTRPMFDFGKN